MATSKRVQMKVPASAIKWDVLYLFSAVFLAIELELVFGDMVEVEWFVSENSADNVIFCSSLRSWGVVPEKNELNTIKHGKNHSCVRIVDNGDLKYNFIFCLSPH